MPPKKEFKKISFDTEAQAKILSGAEKIYNTVSTTYGPAGSNAILGMPFGDPTVTRDGVTVAKRVVLPDSAEDDAAQIIRQASEKTNKTAGDGTTATVVLAYHLLKHGAKLVAAGHNRMVLKKQMVEDSRKVIDFLNKQSTKGDEYLREVANVSAGDPAIGNLISDTIKDVGTDGGISIREQNYPTLDVEKVNGYFFDKGFFALNQMVEYAKPLIFVTQKQMASDPKGNKNLVIIGDVRMNSEAMNTLILNVVQGKLNAVVIPPPAFGDEAALFMDDIATYVGSTVFSPAQDYKTITEDLFGSAERVQVTQDRAIIFKGIGSADAISERAAIIRKQANEEKESHRKDQLEQRYSKLTGKIAIVNVGGSTLAEMEELRYRVEDSIEATKSAAADGVLPGGGTMFVHAMKLDISPLFKDALKDTFGKLMENAGESPDYRREQVNHAKLGHGFNLREITDEPINLKESGIWDATRAIVQTVENAVSAAATLLTVGVIVDPIPEETPKPNA